MRLECVLKQNKSRKKGDESEHAQHRMVQRLHYIFYVQNCTLMRLQPIPDLSRGHYTRVAASGILALNRRPITSRNFSTDRPTAARSREIHRIGQARVNSTVLNREIASRL
jgi:hypothetical protein